MKKNLEDVLKIFEARNIIKKEWLEYSTAEEILVLYLYVITWKELTNEWVAMNIIDIQPWDDSTIRVSIDNVMKNK